VIREPARVRHDPDAGADKRAQCVAVVSQRQRFLVPGGGAEAAWTSATGPATSVVSSTVIRRVRSRSADVPGSGSRSSGARPASSRAVTGWSTRRHSRLPRYSSSFPADDQRDDRGTCPQREVGDSRAQPADLAERRRRSNLWKEREDATGIDDLPSCDDVLLEAARPAPGPDRDDPADAGECEPAQARAVDRRPSPMKWRRGSIGSKSARTNGSTHVRWGIPAAIHAPAGLPSAAVGRCSAPSRTSRNRRNRAPIRLAPGGPGTAARRAARAGRGARWSRETARGGGAGDRPRWMRIRARRG
jgi:hypothetical protein